MGKYEKLLIKILSGTSDHNIRFNELVNLLVKLGFTQRIKGSHYIFYKEKVQEIINIQEKDGLAKSYQVKQIRDIVAKYGLKII